MLDNKVPPATIVFDLDGTLVDTAPDLIGALNHVLVHLGREPLPMGDIRKVVGQGAAAMIERGMALTGGMPANTPPQDLLALFLDHYSAHLSAQSRPFDGVTASLDHLAALGHRMAVCTNKPATLAKRLINDLALGRYFDVILGGDSLAVRKPDPTHLIETIRQAGGHPDYAMMVGDSPPDIGAAKAANVPAIAVSFGYSLVAAVDLGADRLIHHFNQLPTAVSELLARD